MKIDKSCNTCEFNFREICKDKYYDQPIKSLEEDQDCWSMGLDYFNYILNQAPENLRQAVIHGHKDIDDVIMFLSQKNRH